MDACLDGMAPVAQHQFTLQIVLEQTRNLSPSLETMDEAGTLAFESKIRVPWTIQAMPIAILKSSQSFYQAWHMKGSDGIEVLGKWRAVPVVAKTD
jgi:hypothetical protein